MPVVTLYEINSIEKQKSISDIDLFLPYRATAALISHFIDAPLAPHVERIAVTSLFSHLLDYEMKGTVCLSIRSMKNRLK